MTEEPSNRFRISISRKGFRGQVFASVAAEINNPDDPVEVAAVIAGLKSPGMTAIAEAIEDRIDDEVEAGISRIRGERRDRIGLAPVNAPKRKKTAAPPPPPGQPPEPPFIPSVMDQRNRIRQIVTDEDDAQGHPAKRNFLNAILKKEGASSLNDISFGGAERVLEAIDERRKTEPEGFRPARQLTDDELHAEADEAAIDADRAKKASIAKEEGDMETYDRMMRDLEQRGRGEPLTGDPDTEREGVEISKHEAELYEAEQKKSGFEMLEGPDGGELTKEDKEVQLEVAKAEADEIDGVEE